MAICSAGEYDVSRDQKQPIDTESQPVGDQPSFTAQLREKEKKGKTSVLASVTHGGMKTIPQAKEIDTVISRLLAFYKFKRNPREVKE